MIIFWWYYIPRFSDLERDYAHQENTPQYKQLDTFVATAVGKLYTHM